MPETKNNVYNIFVYEIVLFEHTFTETLPLWKSETNSLLALFMPSFILFIFKPFFLSVFVFSDLPQSGKCKNLFMMGDLRCNILLRECIKFSLFLSSEARG